MDLKTLSVAADVIGIFSAGLSLVIFFRTGSIKNSLKKKYITQRNMGEFEKIRVHCMNELMECSDFLSRNRESVTYKDVMPYIDRIDSVLTDIIRYHPSLTKDDEEAIKRIKSCIAVRDQGQYFSYLRIIADIHDITSMLRVEATVYD